jgi:hypothetical protein
VAQPRKVVGACVTLIRGTVGHRHSAEGVVNDGGLYQNILKRSWNI